MTDRRPLVNISGQIKELPTGDLVDSVVLPTPSGALIDGGNPSTVTAGNLRIDFGSPT